MRAVNGSAVDDTAVNGSAVNGSAVDRASKSAPSHEAVPRSLELSRTLGLSALPSYPEAALNL